MKTRAINTLNATDTRMLFWLNHHSRHHTIGFASRQISRLGDGPLYAVTGLLLWAFEPQHGGTVLALGLAAYLIELPIYFLLKNTFRRSRPCHRLYPVNAMIEPSDYFSFPSGHTAAAFLFATLLSTFYPLFTLPLLALALLIGLSRVALGVHYPSDILAGALLGSACAGFALMLAGAS